jgi:hypothetical protein
MRRRRDPTSLSALEKAGAWLGIWTPPKGVPIPPVPTRKLAVSALAAAAALGLLAAWAVPRIEHGKDVGAARERRARVARERVERRRLAADQRPRTTRVGGRPARPAALVPELERAITADARARARRGLIDGPIVRTVCEHVDIGGEERLAAVLGRYRCTALSRPNRSIPGFPFAGGYPFIATIRFRERRLTWCKENPRPGEGATRAAIAVKLSRSCAGPLRDIL